MKMRIRIIISLLLLPAFLFCRGNDSLKIIELKSKIKPLSPDFTAADADLLFLVDQLKDKEIIATGEATHGTKEFFTMKHRLFRTLCLNGDMRVFGLEESYASGLLVNEFIHGESNLKANEVVMKMSFMWRTKEMKDFVEWMKEYNDDPSHTKKIEFFGFDFHGPHHAVKWLHRYFEKVDSTYLLQVKAYLQKFEDKTYPNEKIKDKQYAEHVSYINSIRDRLKSNKQQYENIAGAEKWTNADHLLACLLQYIDTYRSGDVDFFKRDPYMSANVQWMQSKLNGSKRMMLWAHNEHVAAGKNLPSMGKLLKQNYGDKFYNIGFVFNEGEYTGTKQYKCPALEAGIFSFSPAPSGTFCHVVSLTGVRAGFLPMDTEGLDARTAAWYVGAQRVYEVGYRGFDNMKKLLLKKRKLGELYNGIIFIGKVTNTEHYLFGGVKSNAIYFNPFPPN